jgi:hypothetical protein
MDLLDQQQGERLNTTADLDAYDFPPAFIALLTAAIATGEPHGTRRSNASTCSPTTS